MQARRASLQNSAPRTPPTTAAARFVERAATPRLTGSSHATPAQTPRHSANPTRAPASLPKPRHAALYLHPSPIERYPKWCSHPRCGRASGAVAIGLATTCAVSMSPTAIPRAWNASQCFSGARPHRAYELPTFPLARSARGLLIDSAHAREGLRCVMRSRSERRPASLKSTNPHTPTNFSHSRTTGTAIQNVCAVPV